MVIKASEIVIHQMMVRLTPAVQEIVRQDLIQAVGNALRMEMRRQNDMQEIEQFAEQTVKLGGEWGTF